MLFATPCRYAWGALMKNQFNGERNVQVGHSWYEWVQCRRCRRRHHLRRCCGIVPPACLSLQTCCLSATLAPCLPRSLPVPCMPGSAVSAPAATPDACPVSAALSCPDLAWCTPAIDPLLLQFVNGYTVLDYYGLEGINMWGWLGIEAVFATGAFFYVEIFFVHLRKNQLH